MNPWVCVKPNTARLPVELCEKRSVVPELRTSDHLVHCRCVTCVTCVKPNTARQQRVYAPMNETHLRVGFRPERSQPAGTNAPPGTTQSSLYEGNGTGSRARQRLLRGREHEVCLRVFHTVNIALDAIGVNSIVDVTISFCGTVARRSQKADRDDGFSASQMYSLCVSSKKLGREGGHSFLEAPPTRDFFATERLLHPH